MNIQSGAKTMVLAAALALSLVVPNVEAAPPAGRNVSKLTPATIETGKAAVARFEFTNASGDVAQLLALIQNIVSQRVLNRDVLLDNNNGHRETGRNPFRRERLFSGPRPSSLQSGMFPFPFFSSPSSTGQIVGGDDY
jgi:hypothetical protein